MSTEPRALGDDEIAALRQGAMCFTSAASTHRYSGDAIDRLLATIDALRSKLAAAEAVVEAARLVAPHRWFAVWFRGDAQRERLAAAENLLRLVRCYFPVDRNDAQRWDYNDDEDMEDHIAMRRDIDALIPFEEKKP